MKKRTIVILSVSLGGVFLLALGMFYFISHRVVLDNTKFSVKDSLIDVYSEKKLSDLITLDGKILEDTMIDTTKLGKQNLSFLYEVEKKRYKGTLEIEVVDREEPLIWLNKSYRIKKGSNVDLASEILCADNYDSNPTCKIEGEYDLDTVGVYPLHYIAIDSSNNKEDIAFNLSVYEPKKTSSSEEDTYTAFSEVLTSYKREDNEIGIDVSKWQGEIDFSKVKEAGATFVMIRIGSQREIGGEYILDPYFKENIKKAKESGLKVGVYFYSYADSTKEAKIQAKWIVKELQKETLDLPIVFDWECYSSFNQMDLSLFGLNQVAEEFIKTVEELGYEGMLYGSKNYLNQVWKYHSKKNTVWLAHYTKQTDYDADYVMWQLCSDGRIPGIKGDVDINILYSKKNN